MASCPAVSRGAPGARQFGFCLATGTPEGLGAETQSVTLPPGQQQPHKLPGHRCPGAGLSEFQGWGQEGQNMGMGNKMAGDDVTAGQHFHSEEFEPSVLWSCCVLAAVAPSARWLP